MESKWWHASIYAVNACGSALAIRYEGRCCGDNLTDIQPRILPQSSQLLVTCSRFLRIVCLGIPIPTNVEFIDSGLCSVRYVHQIE
eukprot:3705942-Amphidinium_carterae.1